MKQKLKVSEEQLKQRQALPLEVKILMTKQRILRYFEEYGSDGVYLSYSGGKDSTVLKHILEEFCKEYGYSMPTIVYLDTWMEYPEIRDFVKRSCERQDLVCIKPELDMKQIIKKCGWCFPGKEMAECIEAYLSGKEWAQRKLSGYDKDGNRSEIRAGYIKWKSFANHLPKEIKISRKCCLEMKEKPAKKYEEKTGKHWINALMADEGRNRRTSYMRTGCISLEGRPTCTPIGFWTEQDILKYTIQNNIQQCSVYGQIKEENVAAGQMTFCPGCYKYCLTGEKRTGCVFCPVGCHLSMKIKNGKYVFEKYERLKQSRAKMYDYCMRQLGLEELLEYICEWKAKTKNKEW